MHAKVKSQLVSSVVIAVAMIAAASLTRWGGHTYPATVGAALVLSGGLVLSMAVLTATPFSKRAMVAAALILSIALVLPVALTPQPSPWGENLVTLAFYAWFCLFLPLTVGMEKGARCASARSLIWGTLVLAALLVVAGTIL